LRVAVEEAFGDLLQEFGYEVDDVAAS